MIGKDLISILITFVVGLFAGAYLYLNGFATTFVLPEATTQDTYTEFVIIGESYGVCNETNTCLSFQLVENGSYRALYDDPLGGEQLAEEGTIPGTLKRQLYKALTHEALEVESEPLNNPQCHYGAETNYYFRITRDEINYVLDTCQSSINYEGSAWTLLSKLWNYFATLE